MNLHEMRLDCAIKQKKGLHFILASVVIWCALIIVHLSNLHSLTKNMLTFFCTAPLIPLAFLISKFIGVDFQNKGNQLTNLGILFSANQMLYLLIAMWVYSAVPEKMLMVLAMIFGAHLLPYGWLYKSRAYMVLSVFIPILALIVGQRFEAYVLALMMAAIEVVFSVWLMVENKNLAANKVSTGL